LKLNELLKLGTHSLKSSGIESFIIDARLILCHVLNCDMQYIIVNIDEEISPDSFSEYLKLIKIRISGMPISYITGKKEFMSLEFIVNSDVLIPRPDTETLAEYVINYFSEQGKNSNISILDIGTGSGNIAVSIAYYLPNAFVYGIDISKRAVDIAKENALLNGVDNRTKFDICDIKNYSLCETKFDAIVSNPPYIRTDDLSGLMTDVINFEPEAALDGGKDGLLYYRIIIEKGFSLLKSVAIMAFEIGHDQYSEVKQLFEQHGGYENIKIVKDLAGINRVIIAKMKY